MLDEAKRCALDAAVERSLLEPGNVRRWLAAILTAYEPFHRRYFSSNCVAGMAASRGYPAVLRFWR